MRYEHFDAAASPVAFGEHLDIGQLEVRRAGERIDGRDGLADRIAAGEVEGGARRCGRIHAGDWLDLVVGDTVRPGVDAGRRATVVVEQLGRLSRVDPFGAVHRRRRLPGDDAAPPRP